MSTHEFHHFSDRTYSYRICSGYARTCEQIIGAARKLKKAIQQDFQDDLYILGDPLVSVVAFSSKTLNIYVVGDLMSKRGWHLNALANPSALHLAVTVSWRLKCMKLGGVS